MKFLDIEEQKLRQEKLQQFIRQQGLDGLLVSSNANLYYVSGAVYAGYAYVPAEGNMLYLVRRPVGIEHPQVVYIRKPEQILDVLESVGIAKPARLALELDRLPYNMAKRLQAAFNVDDIFNGSPILSQSRSVKTPFEIELIRQSGIRHSNSYQRIDSVFEVGMTDVEFQIEMERVLRCDGCLGIFRISGETMELFMGNVLGGENADTPTPYDFAMGGEGLDQSLPIGCNGTVLRRGNTLMVDMNGNFTGYMTDMTRSFRIGDVPQLAIDAHRLSIDIHNRLREAIRPGFAAAEAYNLAVAMVTDAGLDDYFMGHRQKAGFIGHGVGIEVNELPVLAPRSRDVFSAGNVIAIEPKFVIPGVGAVGVENTYLVTDNGLECLTNFPEELADLCQ